MLEVQKYLRTNHSYEDLENNFGIRVVPYEDRVVLNYSQIDSYKQRFEPIVMECRSLILDLNHEILSRSFDRFFNYGEDPNSETFNIENSVAYDKIDGSIMTVYFDGAKWQVSSRQMAFAEGPVPNKSKSYRDVFIEALGVELDLAFKDVDKEYCTIFEMVSPETRVVTPYPKSEIFLLDVRNKFTGEFLGLENAWYWSIPEEVHWKYPNTHFFNTIEECIKASNDLPAMEEGYVLVNDIVPENSISDKWRIKVKNPAYLAIAHLRENGAVTEKRVVKLVIFANHEEYLEHFPEDREFFEPWIKANKRMVEDVAEYKAKYFHIEDQKEFAMKIKDCHGKHILFGIRKGRTFSDMIEDFTDNFRVRLLKGYKK